MSNVTYQQPAAPTGGKHPVNILHLVMGVVFLGIVSIWALIEGQIATTEDLRWLIPLPWVIAGAAGLIVIMMSRGSEPTAPDAGYEYAARAGACARLHLGSSRPSSRPKPSRLPRSAPTGGRSTSQTDEIPKSDEDRCRPYVARHARVGQDVRMSLPSLGGLVSLSAVDHPELLAPSVAAALASWSAVDQIAVVEIDPEHADTAAMVAAYDVPLDAGANCVVVAGRRDGEERVAACLVRADTRADVNNLVKRTLDVRKCSFLSMDRAVEESAMEYGGITPDRVAGGVARPGRQPVPRHRHRDHRLRRTPLEVARPRATARPTSGC